MKVLILSMLLLLTALTPITGAQDAQNTPIPSSPAWRLFGTSSDGIDYYFMRKSSFGDIREIWFKNEEGGTINIALKRFNCESGADRLLEVTEYKGDQKDHTSTFADADTKWGYAEPTTMGEAMLNAACGGPRKREWTYIGSSKDDEEFFLKLGTLTRVGNLVTVWSKSLKNEETESVILYGFDCTAARIRVVQSTIYRSGNVLSTHSSKSVAWEYAVPDSMGEHMLRTACRTSKSKARPVTKPK